MSRRMEIKKSALLPNLLTIGNGICGFAAITHLARVESVAGELAPLERFGIAAWLILLGMAFDVFDGKLARTINGGSELGAQLDSLCDLITFGMAPAFLIVRLNILEGPGWQKMVWFFALAYFLGALLRLARFNVESSAEESPHVAFRGLPTPAAAGCVASLVVFMRYLQRFDAAELALLEPVLDPAAREVVRKVWSYALAFLAPVLGFMMVAVRIQFDHVGSWLFARRQSIDFQVYVIFALVLLATIPEIVLPFVFYGYLLHTPLRELYRRIRPSRARRRPPPEPEALETGLEEDVDVAGRG